MQKGNATFALYMENFKQFGLRRQKTSKILLVGDKEFIPAMR